MAKRYSAVNQSRCVACGECVNACPRGAIRIQRGCFAVTDIDSCVGCGLCEKYCPAGAIAMLDWGNESESEVCKSCQ